MSNDNLAIYNGYQYPSPCARIQYTVHITRNKVTDSVNADSPGSYLVNFLTNYLVVLWLGGRSCSESFWFQTWCIDTACHAVAERIVYDLGGWSILQFFLPLTLPDTEILDGRELGTSDVLGHMHYPLKHLEVGCQAVAIPSSDAASQDALNDAAV